MSTDRSRAHYNRARRYARDGYEAKGSKALAHLGRAIDYAGRASATEFGEVMMDCPAFCYGNSRYAYSADGKPPADPRECRVCRGAKKIDGALYDAWKKDADYARYAGPDILSRFYGRVSLEDYNTLKNRGNWTRFENTHGEYIILNSCLLIERAAPSTGARCPSTSCIGGRVTRQETCRVCGGRGVISKEESEAWMQDTGYVASLRSYPDTYSGFCETERREYIKMEALEGRVPSTTLAEFIRDRRSRLGILPIKESLIDISVGRGEILMSCPFECTDGKYTPNRYDPDVVKECRMCEPYGGTGTIAASVLAKWMRDPEYRSYYNATQPRERLSHGEWRRHPTRVVRADDKAHGLPARKVNRADSKESPKKRQGKSGGGCCCS